MQRLQFFSPESKQGKVTIGQEDQKHMSMPTRPGTTFMMVHSQFFFHLLITMFNPVSFMVKPDHFYGWGILGMLLKKYRNSKSPGLLFFLISMISHASSFKLPFQYP